MPKLNRIYKDYSSSNIEFIGVFPNFSSKKEKILSFVEDYEISYKIQTDYFKKLSNKYEVSVVPSVVVTDAAGDKIYKGRIDNSYYQIGKRRRVVYSFELINVLESMKSGVQQKFKDQIAIGCFINYSELK